MDQDTTAIFLTCLFSGSETAKAERLAHVSVEEWHLVAELAKQECVAPLLYYHLQRMNIVFPGDIEKELMEVYRTTALLMIRLYQELNKILRRLHEKGIPVIVLKGAYLAEAIYMGIGLRTMGDVDLLVKKEDLLLVEQELLAIGCIPELDKRVITPEDHHFVYKMPRSGLRVEIHWRIFHAKFPIQIDVEDLWSRAQPVILAQAPARVFAPEDLLLHLCLHTANHTYMHQVASEMRTRMFCDIGEVVRHFQIELDWQEIGSRARQWGTVHAVYVILRLAKELLGVEVPADWLASIQPTGFDPQYLESARRIIFAPRVKGNVVTSGQVVDRLWGQKGFIRKLVLIRDHLLPSRENMAAMYPAPANSWRIFLYYPVRWKEALVNNSAKMWRLARGDPETRTAVDRSNQLTTLRDWLKLG